MFFLFFVFGLVCAPTAFKLQALGSVCNTAVDLLLGMTVAHLFVSPPFRSACRDAATQAATLVDADVLGAQVAWLMDVPGGVKINQSWSRALGSLVRLRAQLVAPDSAAHAHHIIPHHYAGHT